MGTILALAVIIASPGLFGLYWIGIGFPGPPADREGRFGRVVKLDLGTGAAGVSGNPPELTTPRSGEVVVLSFVLATGAGAPRSLQLLGPSGRPLMPALPIGDLDPPGVFSYPCDAALLQAAGDYELLVTQETAAGRLHESRFPFRVEAAPRAP